MVGLHGGVWYGPMAEKALREADVLVGAARQFEELKAARLGREQVVLWGPLGEVAELCAARSAGGERVCVLAAGDPGFFGLVRLLGARLGPESLDVHPAPSSVSLAFARAGLTWDDAIVATCHGRPLADAVSAVLHAPKAAVLVGPDAPPQALGAALVEAKCGPREVWVASHLGESDEEVQQMDLTRLAAGSFDPLSVVVLVAPGAAVPGSAGLVWGIEESAYEHRDSMITKAEVRAVVLSKLSLPARGVLWDVGAGSGSVAIEAARSVPGLRAFAVERDPSACGQIASNARGTGVVVVEGSAPAVLAGLPDPDRVFVGGGGLGVVDTALDRLRPGGRVVATYAVMETAVAAAGRLGSLVQVAVSRGRPVGERGALRLQAENPVFVVWGPA